MLLQNISFLLFCITSAEAFYSKAKTYVVNLDIAPEQRWNEVVLDHLPYRPMIHEEIGKYFKFPYGGLLCWLCEKLSLSFPEEYTREMHGIANASGIEFCHIVGLNILYDITNYNNLISAGLGCSSIIAEDSNGRILHGRNLDYMMKELMQNLSIMVQFEKKGKVIYSALTFAFFAGVTTGQRTNAFTLSLNARRTGWYIFTILMEIYTAFQLPIGFALRQTLHDSASYCDALDYLSKIHFVAPSYLILAGTKSGEGALITRNRWAAAEVFKLNSAEGRWYIVQTNYDRWDKDEDNRRTTAQEALHDIGQANFDEEVMLAVLRTPPVTNSFTITTSVMSAATPDMLFNTTTVIIPDSN